MRSMATRHQLAVQRTGSGPPPPPPQITTCDEQVFAIMHPEVLAGVAGGLDSGQRSSEKGYWAKDIQTLGVFDRRSTPCHKQCGDLRCWARKTAKAQLGMASQRGRGVHRTLTALMFRILAVAYPELDGRLKASLQPQGVVLETAGPSGAVLETAGPSGAVLDRKGPAERCLRRRGPAERCLRRRGLAEQCLTGRAQRSGA
ncbi:hypothetical protein NDU88_005118 [Pleurodeles waltl]|uniref:Uncharacterized protein n=1 Tax=Pleurodeles waltl TaxID=8319 RepID=A0AAV7TTE3_PLEWA|nr:hypothetical protein NDU88_005118 [Pleurodeles waltl]